MAKKVTVKVNYGWVGTSVDVSEFITSAEDENEIEKEAFDEAENMIFDHASWSYEVEDIEDGNE